MSGDSSVGLTGIILNKGKAILTGYNGGYLAEVKYICCEVGLTQEEILQNLV